MDKEMNSSGSRGASKIVPLGHSTPSSNAWLGIDKRVEAGSFGARETISAAKYGGDRKEGVWFKGKSASSPSREMNSGDKEKNTTADDQFKAGSVYQGTYGSREQMTIGGGKNKGKFAGKGDNSTKQANPKDQYVGGKTQPGQDLVLGTNEDRNRQMGRAMKGIGKPTGNKRSKE